MLKFLMMFGALLLMVFNGLLQRGAPKGSTYTSPERLYLDKDGNVVSGDDPNKVSLLVAEGGEISEAEARKYGLIDDAGEPVKRETQASDREPEKRTVRSRKTVAGPDEVKTAAPTDQTQGEGPTGDKE